MAQEQEQKQKNPKKCAHPSCNCLVDKWWRRYCSDICHDAGGSMELSCNCRHPQCAERGAAAAAAGA